MDCGKLRKPISAKARREYEEKYPRPALGKPFKCPVCQKTKIPWHKNQICLDHNHKTGKIRGYLCGDCNASIGRIGDSIPILKRAIKWLEGKIKNYILF